MWEFDLLSIDVDREILSLGGFDETDNSLSLLGFSDGDLGTRQNNLQLDILSSEVLGRDGHGLLSRAVSGQEGVAVLGNLGVETTGNIVKGGQITSLKLASGLRVVSSDVIKGVLVNGLGGSQRQEGADKTSRADIIEGQDGVWAAENQVPETGVWGVDEFSDNSALWGGLLGFGLVVVGNVWVVQVLNEIFNLFSDVADFLWQILVPLEGQSPLVESSGLLVGDFQARVGDGESLLLIFFAVLSFIGFLGGVFGHFLVTDEFSVKGDFVVEVGFLAGGTEFVGSFNLDFQVLGEERFTEDSQDPLVGVLWGNVFSSNFDTGIFLLLGIFSLDDGITEDLEGSGVGWEGFGSLVGSISRSSMEEDLVRSDGDLEEILDLGFNLLVQIVVDGSLVFNSWDGLSFTENGQSNDTGFLEGFLRVLERVGVGVGLGGRRAGGRGTLLFSLLSAFRAGGVRAG